MQLPAALSVSAGTGDTGPDVTGAADDDAAAGPGRDR
jgi:hypothetical protein